MSFGFACARFFPVIVGRPIGLCVLPHFLHYLFCCFLGAFQSSCEPFVYLVHVVVLT